MQACPHPEIPYPSRIPLKVIGRLGLLEPARVAELILAHLGPQPEADLVPTVNPNGAYIAYTFWVTLPDERIERPLREAIHALPGCVMQL